MGVLCCLMLAPAAAVAQPQQATVTETIQTRSETDVNGHDAVWEQVVTRRAQTGDADEVVIEFYQPSIEGGRLALIRRVRRVITPTADGSRIVEETEARSIAFPQDPAMRVVKRSVTTVRRSGPDAYVSERQEFELDVNGRFVPARKEIAQSGGR